MSHACHKFRYESSRGIHRDGRCQKEERDDGHSHTIEAPPSLVICVTYVAHIKKGGDSIS